MSISKVYSSFLKVNYMRNSNTALDMIFAGPVLIKHVITGKIWILKTTTICFQCPYLIPQAVDPISKSMQPFFHLNSS